jgi:hypothetical protein
VVRYLSNVESLTVTGVSMDHITTHIGKRMGNSKRNTLVDMTQEKKQEEKYLKKIRSKKQAD